MWQLENLTDLINLKQKMKKLLFLGLFTASTVVCTNANAQAVEQGSVIVDVYAGYGSLYNAVFRALITDTENDASFSSIDAIGLRGEYLVADRFGVGLDICYSGAKLVDPYTYTVYNPATLKYSDVIYEQTYKTRKIGVMASLNYHFLDNDRVDAYGTFGVGYKNRNTTSSTTNPDPLYGTATINSVIPIAMRLGGGMRYFFTENIGINLGVGFGQGGFINGGVSLKF